MIFPISIEEIRVFLTNFGEIYVIFVKDYIFMRFLVMYLLNCCENVIVLLWRKSGLIFGEETRLVNCEFEMKNHERAANLALLGRFLYCL